MDKKRYAMTAVVGIVMFGAGFLARMAWDGYEKGQETAEALSQVADVVEQNDVISPEQLAEQGYLSVDVLQIRIDDGQVQWYDGRLWHAVAMVEELKEKDRFYLAEEAFAEFNEQLRQESAAKRQDEDDASESEGALLVGQKEAPKPTAPPKTTVTKPQAQAPQATPAPNTAPADSSSSGNNGSSGGSNNNTPPATPDVPQDSGGSNNDTPPAVPDVPQDSGDSGDAGDSGDTGDGENMEWTDDYL